MARAAVLGRLIWRLGTVLELVDETPRARSIVLDVPEWPGHLAGQHVDVRLTAEDGYQAQRSYSIASAPEDAELVLTVERLEDGEVSSYLVDELRPGDNLEFRGPVGGFFVWEASFGGPLLLVAGGSGVVPFRSIVRHHLAVESYVPLRLLTPRTLGFSRQLDRLAASREVASSTLTANGRRWSGTGRIDGDAGGSRLAGGRASPRLPWDRRPSSRQPRRASSNQARSRPDQNRAVRPAGGPIVTSVKSAILRARACRRCPWEVGADRGDPPPLGVIVGRSAWRRLL
jgi:ferredoxin-NADP reductase